MTKDQKHIETLSNGQEISFRITYNKEMKAYRLNAVPIKRSFKEGFTLTESESMSGFNDTLLYVERQSEKRFERAILIFFQKKTEYVNWFNKKFDLTLIQS